ncbi:MAG: methylated-DNA--[protein]-cysteine S-methyltransferase [Gemmatimonadales bacterium]|jgi:AraC family transcriptional regulator of adaptative response/methylated-DNA-[protein]-cysteine methyltransferase
MTTMMTTTAKRASDTFDVSIAKSTLGLVLIAGSDAGVAAVLLGDERADLRADLARRFPRATLRDAGNKSAAVVARVVKAIDGATTDAASTIPLDLRGTEFQRAVWRALRAIPRGSTATYSEIAARIGQPGAARGVAQACAANPVAVLVPCHRVVRADGALSGYRWGIERKRALLERESAA